MDELQNIKNESLKSVKIRNTSTNMDHGTVNSLQTKIKQKLIDSILEHNCDLIQTQNVFVQYHSVTRKINDKIISHTNTNNALRNDKKNESNVPKGDRFTELQVSFKDLHPQAHQAKVKKNIVVIGDSLIKNVNGRDVSRGNSVKIRPHPGTSTEDLIDHIKPAIRKNPDIVVIHNGTNDLQNNCYIVKKAKKLVSVVKEVDKDNSIKIAFSSIINREDEDFKDVNNKLKNCCNSAGMDFVDNSKIDGSCLNRGKLHVNRKGTAALAKNFCRFVRSLPVDWNITGREGAFTTDEINLLDNRSDISEMKKLRQKNPKNITFSYLNINSVRNKFQNMSSLISENVDILTAVETKLDSSFPTTQFVIPGFHHLIRLDIKIQSGGLLVYVKWSIPARVLTSFSTTADTQIIVFEINLRKEKWLFVAIYKPPSLNSQYFLDTLSDLLDFYSNHYDSKIILGDFNLKPTDPLIMSFLNEHDLINLIKNNTCFKGEGSCIDLILTNRKFSFKNSTSFETDLSDHHNLFYSVFKTTFYKEEPKTLIYLDYKTFSLEKFSSELFFKLESQENNDYQTFETKFVDTLNNQAPKKSKIFRGNQKPHINKILRNAIMKRSQLKNKANKTKSIDDLIKYKKQRDLVVKLNKNCKKEFFDNLETKNNSKSFWDKCKPYFSNKHSKSDSDILLIEKGELLLNNKKVADVFNSYFQSITDPLDLFKWPLGSTDQIYDSIDRIIDSFWFHPSIKNIKRNYKITSKFSFKPVSEEFVKDIVNNLSSNKAAGGEIPLKILKECDFSFYFFTNCINEAIKNKKFPDSLKLSNTVPVHKKKDATDKTNYRPVSILPLLSKAFEKVMYIQLYDYMENFLNQLLCGFRKAHSTCAI